MVCVPCLSGGDSPSAQICTKQLLQGAQPGSCWVYILHFQSNTPAVFRSVLKQCPSLRHGAALGCRSLGQPRPQKQLGISKRSIWLCWRHVKQQQLLIASDVS